MSGAGDVAPVNTTGQVVIMPDRNVGRVIILMGDETRSRWSMTAAAALHSALGQALQLLDRVKAACDCPDCVAERSGVKAEPKLEPEVPVATSTPSSPASGAQVSGAPRFSDADLRREAMSYAAQFVGGSVPLHAEPGTAIVALAGKIEAYLRGDKAASVP